MANEQLQPMLEEEIRSSVEGLINFARLVVNGSEEEELLDESFDEISRILWERTRARDCARAAHEGGSIRALFWLAGEMNITLSDDVTALRCWEDVINPT